MIVESTKHFKRVLIGVIQLLACRLGGLAQVCGGGLISFGDSLSSTRFSVHQHGLAALVGFAHDGSFFHAAGTLLIGACEGLLCTGVRFRQNLVAHFKDLLCLAKICWNGQPHLVDDIKHALAIDDQVAANRQPPCLDHQLFETINQVEDFHSARRVPPKG